MTVVLILLLIAAVFGVLGSVLKVALIIVLSVTLAMVLLAGLVWWGVRRRFNRFMREQGPAARGPARPSRPIDVQGRRRPDQELPPEV